MFVSTTPVILAGDAVYKVVKGMSGKNTYEVAAGNGLTNAIFVAYEVWIQVLLPLWEEYDKK